MIGDGDYKNKIMSYLTHIKKANLNYHQTRATSCSVGQQNESHNFKIVDNMHKQSTFRRTNSTSEWQYINKKSIKYSVFGFIEIIKIETTAILFIRKTRKET